MKEIVDLSFQFLNKSVPAFQTAEYDNAYHISNSSDDDGLQQRKVVKEKGFVLISNIH
jgi:hypothetical protein